MTKAGKITNILGVPLEEGVLPIGYCEIQDMAMAARGQTLIADPAHFFIEESEWTPGPTPDAPGVISVIPRGAPDPLKLGVA